MFIYAEISISVQKNEAPGFTRESWLSMNMNVVPNTPVMFAHVGSTPQRWLKGRVSTWNSTNTPNETLVNFRYLRKKLFFDLMSQHWGMVDVQTEPLMSKHHLHKKH